MKHLSVLILYIDLPLPSLWYITSQVYGTYITDYCHIHSVNHGFVFKNFSPSY